MSTGAGERSPSQGDNPHTHTAGAWRWPHWPDPIWVLSKSWETLLHSLHFWDLPWILTAPPQTAPGEWLPAQAPPQLPQPLACLAQECKGGRQGLPLRKLCCAQVWLPGRAASPPSAWCPGRFRALSLSVSLPCCELLSFSQPGPDAFALSHPLSLTFLVLALINREYSDIFEIQPLEALRHSSLTHPGPAPPYPTLLDSTLF